MKKIIKNKLNKLNIIFFSLISVVLIYSFIVLYLKINLKYEDLVKSGSLVLYISPLSMIIVIMLNSYLYKKAIEKAQKITDEIQKLQIFFSTKIIQYLLYGTAGIIATTSLLLEYRSPNIFILVIILSFMIFSIATKKKFINDFISEKEDLR